MKQKAKIAPRFTRFKACVIDIFLLYVPVCYLCWFVLGSGAQFRANQLAITSCWVFFGLAQGAFLRAKAQSPGLKYYNLYLIDANTGGKASFVQILYRYVLFIIGAGLLFGLLMGFFRKDRLMLHDLLSKTLIVERI